MNKDLKTGLTILGCVAGGVAIGVGCYYLGKNFGWIFDHAVEEIPAHAVDFSAPIEMTYNGYVNRLEDILVVTKTAVDNAGEVAKDVVVTSAGADGVMIAEPIADFLYRALSTVGISV